MSKASVISLPASGLRWLAVGAAVGLFVASAGAPNFAPRSALAVDPAAPEHTISVTGIGRVTLTPDVADLRLGVNMTAPTATEARSDAAAAMTKVVDAIKKGGVADKDIQTAAISLQPVYDYSNNGQGKLTGFQVLNIVAVTVRDISKVGDLIDAAVIAGATSVDGVSFRVDDQTSAEAQARTAAVVDARAKANALAAAAGVSITGVSFISENSTTVPYPVPYAGAAPAKDMASTPVQPGTTEIDITVSMVFRIG
jgi:uncharacterized protein YggE